MGQYYVLNECSQECLLLINALCKRPCNSEQIVHQLIKSFMPSFYVSASVISISKVFLSMLCIISWVCSMGRMEDIGEVYSPLLMIIPTLCPLKYCPLAG